MANWINDDFGKFSYIQISKNPFDIDLSVVVAGDGMYHIQINISNDDSQPYHDTISTKFHMTFTDMKSAKEIGLLWARDVFKGWLNVLE